MSLQQNAKPQYTEHKPMQKAKAQINLIVLWIANNVLISAREFKNRKDQR